MAESEQPLRERFEEIIEDAGGDAIDKERMLIVVDKGYRMGYSEGYGEGYGKGYAAAERNCGAMDEEPTSCDDEQSRERSGRWFA